jgi:hypothetical protein
VVLRAVGERDLSWRNNDACRERLGRWKTIVMCMGGSCEGVGMQCVCLFPWSSWASDAQKGRGDAMRCGWEDVRRMHEVEGVRLVLAVGWQWLLASRGLRVVSAEGRNGRGDERVEVSGSVLCVAL